MLIVDDFSSAFPSLFGARGWLSRALPSSVKNLASLEASLLQTHVLGVPRLTPRVKDKRTFSFPWLTASNQLEHQRRQSSNQRRKKKRVSHQLHPLHSLLWCLLVMVSSCSLCIGSSLGCMEGLMLGEQQSLVNDVHGLVKPCNRLLHTIVSTHCVQA